MTYREDVSTILNALYGVPLPQMLVGQVDNMMALGLTRIECVLQLAKLRRLELLPSVKNRLKLADGPGS